MKEEVVWEEESGMGFKVQVWDDWDGEYVDENVRFLFKEDAIKYATELIGGPYYVKARVVKVSPNAN